MSTPATPQKTPADRIGRIGIWSGELRFGDTAAGARAAAELDELGFGAIWTPGGFGGPVLEDMRRLLDATKRTTIASGIINLWKHEPAELGTWWRALPDAHKERTLLGIGVSHGPAIGADYQRPVATTRAYLDKLDAEGIPAEHMCLAALGPLMLDLSAERTAGAHPYLGSPAHTAFARARMGKAALLAPEVGVIFETDPEKARAIARDALGIYLPLPNYTNNWRRFGFTEEEALGAADRLIDTIFGWGDVGAAARIVQAHLDAGADHVCIQVVRGSIRDAVNLPMDQWRALAGALL